MDVGPAVVLSERRVEGDSTSNRRRRAGEVVSGVTPAAVARRRGGASTMTVLVRPRRPRRTPARPRTGGVPSKTDWPPSRLSSRGKQCVILIHVVKVS